LMRIGRGELPVLGRILESLQKAALLLGARHVQEELAHDHSVATEVALESANIREALVPNVLGNQRPREMLFGENLFMHTHDERLLIVRAIEDTDATAFGESRRAAPQEVVIQLLRR